MSLLTLSDIRVRYGSVEVLHGINLRVEEGEIVTISGPTARAKAPPCCPSWSVRPREQAKFLEGVSRLPAQP